jgi:peptide-methionine (R)-S-oxide reductase
MVDRRHLLAGVGALALIAGLRALWSSHAEAADSFEIQKSDGEWRAILPKAQYDVLRRHRTEPAGSSPLNDEKRKGTFACAGCDLALFSSETKYDSRTGWPSFYRPLPDAVGTATDYLLLLLAPRCIAGGAADIWAMSSKTDRRPRDCATASTA